MTTVYLAKSQQADETMVRLVREHLRKLEKVASIRVMEHLGPSTSYNPTIARKADAIIIIPPVHEDNDENSVYVGRGLYKTLQDYLGTTDITKEDLDCLGTMAVPLVAFSPTPSDSLRFYEVIDVSEIKGDWKTKWGVLVLSNVFFDTLNTLWELPTHSVSKSRKGGSAKAEKPGPVDTKEDTILLLHKSLKKFLP